jgi:nucleotide-binding universal stress UspA family protein
MNAKMLLALDGSEHSMKLAHYVADLLGKQIGVSITLFHVLSDIPALTLGYYEGIASTVIPPKQDWIQLEKDEANRCFEQVKNVFLEAGFGDEQILIKCSNPQHGSKVALAICKESKSDDYDTVVVGKHGHSKIHEFLIGSVAEKVVRHTKDRTVWVIE